MYYVVIGVQSLPAIAVCAALVLSFRDWVYQKTLNHIRGE